MKNLTKQEMNKKIATLTKNLKNLQAKFKSKEASTSQMERKLGVIAQERNKLKLLNLNISRELKGKIAIVARLDKENKSLEKKLKISEEKVKNIRSVSDPRFQAIGLTYVELSKENENLVREMQKLSDELGAKETEVDVAREELRKFKKVVRTGSSDCDFDSVSRIVEENSRVVVRNRSLSREISKIKEDLETKNRELESAERIIESISKELEDKETSIQQVTEEIEIFLKEKNYLIDSNEELKQEIEVHKEQNLALMQKIEDLEQNINEIYDKNQMESKEDQETEELRLNLDQLKSKKEELEGKIMDMKRMVLKEKEKRIELEQKAVDHDELENRNADLISKISVLENQLKFHKSNPRSKSISLSNNNFISDTNKSRQKLKSSFKERRGFSDSKALSKVQKSINFKEEEKSEDGGGDRGRSGIRSDSVREMIKEYAGVDFEVKRELDLKRKKDRRSGEWKEGYLKDPKVFSMNSEIIQNMLSSGKPKPLSRHNYHHKLKPKPRSINPTYNNQRKIFENMLKKL